MSDTLEQAKVKWLRTCEAFAQATPREWSANDERMYRLGLELIDDVSAAVRAEAQREAFEAGYMEGFGTNNAETLDAKRADAFAAYLKGQP